jgi:hypothetical protein
MAGQMRDRIVSKKEKRKRKKKPEMAAEIPHDEERLWSLVDRIIDEVEDMKALRAVVSSL